jgi:hypothetical protein
MKKLFVIVAAILACLQSFAINLRSGNNIIINQVITGNLYISGGTVTINAPIHGDLVIGGGTVLINDTVTGDILVGGGKVTLSGYAGDDVRCAGGEIHVAGIVAGDLAGVGGTIDIKSTAMINGGLLIAGGTVNMDGTVKENAKIYGGQININGTAQQDLECQGGNLQINGTINGNSVLSASKIIIGNDAIFNREVRFWTKTGQADFQSSLKNTRATYDPALKMDYPEFRYIGFMTFWGLVWYLGAAFLLILLVHYLLKRILPYAATRQQIVSGGSLGYGLLFLIGVPITIILCFISLVGLPIGFILLFAYITILASGTAITSVVLTEWIQNSRARHWNKWQFAGIAVLIAVAIKCTNSLIPFIGWLFATVLILSSFGAIIKAIRHERKEVPQMSAH